MLSFLRRRTDSTRLQFRVAPGVKTAQHPDGLVLIHLDKGTVFSANRVGAMIWNAVATRKSLETIAVAISTEFDIPAQAAQQDAEQFLTQLQIEGLLVMEA